jgi:hypothetical protein
VTTFQAEVIALSAGLLEPPMTREDVAAWLDRDQSGVFQPIIEAIQRLSGNEAGAGKEYTKSVSGGES